MTKKEVVAVRPKWLSGLLWGSGWSVVGYFLELSCGHTVEVRMIPYQWQTNCNFCEEESSD